jgi:hypothetical protein
MIAITSRVQSAVLCKRADPPLSNRRVGTCHDQGGALTMTKTILVKAVTRRSAVQKITGALGEALPPIGLKKAEVGAALANCRALLSQIDAGLSAKKLFLNVSSAAELLFYLEFAASALEKAAPRPRKRGGTKLALNSH